MLEMDDEIADLYDAGILTHEDFYKAAGSLKNELLKKLESK